MTGRTVKDWAKAIGPQVRAVCGDGESVVTALGTDSREAAPGLLFFALRGERFDGHDFVAAVARAGASGAVVDHELSGLPEHFAQIVVDDVGLAYGEAARAHRLDCGAAVIAVGGSNGKTTTTQMIGGMLRAAYGEKAHATKGNLNNTVGVPRTLLALAADARAAVVEAGMNHPGEMAWLARWIAPTVALITNAQREHQEFLESVRETAYENGLLIAGLSGGGVAVWPAEDPCADVWRSMATARGAAVRTFGLEGTAADVVGRTLDDGALEIRAPEGVVTVRLAIPGEHNRRNAVGAAAAALAAGVPAEAVRDGLEAFRPVKGRGARHADAARGVTVIDESYNANPDSVRAAAAVLAAESGERIFVLGDMGETGREAQAFHREVGAYMRSLGIDRLWCVGELSRFAAEAFGSGAEVFDDVDALVARTERLPDDGVSVTVKASRFMGLERVVEALCRRYAL